MSCAFLGHFGIWVGVFGDFRSKWNLLQPKAVGILLRLVPSSLELQGYGDTLLLYGAVAKATGSV